MIQWQFFPKSDAAPEHLELLTQAFGVHVNEIDSGRHDLHSNAVLDTIRTQLLVLGYDVEIGKKANDRIRVPVLFGRNGKTEKTFDADAVHWSTGTVLEVEAGRGVVNYQFLKDLFQACMMHDVFYLAIAVRNTYRGSPDFEKVVEFLDTLYVSGRLQLPLRGVLIIGY